MPVVSPSHLSVKLMKLSSFKQKLRIAANRKKIGQYSGGYRISERGGQGKVASANREPKF